MFKLITPLFLLVCLASNAQNQAVTKERNISVSPNSSTWLNSKASEPLNLSGFIPIMQGEEFKIASNISLAPKGTHFFRGLLKTAGIFALTYQVQKYSNGGKLKSSTQSSSTLIPSIGMGLAVGLPDMLKGLKNKKVYLQYSLYNKDTSLIGFQKFLLNKKNIAPIFGKASVDGYLKIMVLGDKKRIIPGEMSIALSQQTPVQLKGSIVNTMSLATANDCLGGGGDDINDPCHCRAIALSCGATVLAQSLSDAAACLGFPPCEDYVAASFLISSAVCLTDFAICVHDCKK